jgi:hypothetical protein
MLKLTFASLLLLSTSLPASAAVVIAGYDFNAANGVASTVGANATASSFTAGLGLPVFNFSGNNAVGREFNFADYTTALANGDYFSFTATANAGYVLNLTDLTLREARNSAGPISFQINVNGTAVTPFLSTNTVFTAHTIALSSFTGLSSATIQIVAWAQGTGVPGQRNWFNDDVNLNGTVDALVHTPEASSVMVWSLLCVVIGGVGMFRRQFAL